MRSAIPLTIVLLLACVHGADFADRFLRATDAGGVDGPRRRRELSGKNSELRNRVIELLRMKLFEIGRVVPSAGMEKLREVPIWVELKDKRHPGMCYHVSAEWLKSNGYNPEKAGGVELANAGELPEVDAPPAVDGPARMATHTTTASWGPTSLSSKPP